MTDPKMDRVEDEVAELRRVLVRADPVPPWVAQRIEAVIHAEVQRMTTVSWAEASTLLCLVFLIAGAALPWSLTLPLLGVGCLASALYALGIRRILREAQS